MKSPASIPKSEGTLPERLPSVDVLRGMVMVLMVLDHTRDFFSNANFRVRVLDVASGSGATSRDFSLDWIAVRVSYQK